MQQVLTTNLMHIRTSIIHWCHTWPLHDVRIKIWLILFGFVRAYHVFWCIIFLFWLICVFAPCVMMQLVFFLIIFFSQKYWKHFATALRQLQASEPPISSVTVMVAHVSVQDLMCRQLAMPWQWQLLRYYECTEKYWRLSCGRIQQATSMLLVCLLDAMPTALLVLNMPASCAAAFALENGNWANTYTICNAVFLKYLFDDALEKEKFDSFGNKEQIFLFFTCTQC